ncbi:MAG: hypothetical protein U1C13_05335, partial [Pseudomonas sp.]|nr:hypothetical protein [Pseudomonas sp.]
MNVFSHCLPHSAELFRFSAFQFTNEASGHLNHKPGTSTCHHGGWVVPINGARLADGVFGVT